MNYIEPVLDYIRDYISREEITAKEFANRIGKNGSVVTHWLRGDREPDMYNIVCVADFLNCSLGFLFGRPENPEFIRGKGERGFLERLIERKRTLKVKNADIARACEIEPATVSKWFNGKIPRPETFIKLADFLNCSLDYLVGRSDSV